MFFFIERIESFESFKVRIESKIILWVFYFFLIFVKVLFMFLRLILV